MRHHPPLVQMQTACCLLCDRVAGQLIAGRFVRNQDGPLPASKNGTLRCGHCGGNLHLQPSPPATAALAAQLLAQPSRPDEQRTPPVAYDGGTPTGAGTRVVQLSVSEIGEAPAARNSRVRDDDHALDELAASIRRHGLLQPIIVRPSGTDDLPTGPRYIVIAGSRRLRAARRANLSSVACLIRVTNADDAFVLAQ